MKSDRTKREELPRYCDFSCPHAAFGDPSAVGACRRDIGVWCTLARRYNAKNAACVVKKNVRDTGTGSADR